MLQYISRPEFGLSEQRTDVEELNYEHSCNTTEKSTINYTSTENAVLSLCSMNIAKNHWVTFKCTVYFITLTGACDFLALEQFYSI